MLSLFKKILLLGILTTSTIHADTILYYDSQGGTALEQITSQTNSAFVSSSEPNTTLGSNTTFHSQHNSQKTTVSLGSGNDLMFQFGGISETLTAPLSPDYAENDGYWIGTSFTAAQNLTLDSISVNIFVNRQNSSNYAARDCGLFVRIGNSGPFIQFGNLFDTNTVANQGTVNFTDNFTVLDGEEVELRLAFTDRTRINTSVSTASTRIGSLNISAVEPTLSVTANNTAPPSGPVDHSNFGSFTTTWGNFSANPYYGRGQSFMVADTGDANTHWEVNSLSLRSKLAKTFGPGDKIRIWLFEWNPDNNGNDTSNWTTNLGILNSNGLADGDPLNGTNINTVLIDGADYTLPSSIATNNYLHFNFLTPLTLEENKSYGVFFEFIDADQNVGDTEIRLGLGGGSNTYNDGSELQTTNTSNGSTSRDLTLFLSGSVITQTYNVIANTTAPSTGPVSHSNFNSYTTTWGNFSSNPYNARGQTFKIADTGDANTLWDVSSFSLRSKQAKTFGNGDKMRIWLFEWNPDNNGNDISNWTANSDGFSDGDPFDNTNINNILINGLDYLLPSSIASNNYLHFNLPLGLTLEENKTYGILFEFIDSDQNTGATSIRVGLGNGGSSTYADGRELQTKSNTNNTASARDVTLFLSGSIKSGTENSTIVLGSPFQDRMVLQRNKPVKVWGTAATNSSVTVSINGSSTSTTSDNNGNFVATLPAQPHGGPYALTVEAAGNTKTINDVLIGDVWLCFGQSNMVYTLSQMASWNTTYINGIAANDNVRCLKITQNGSLTEQNSGSMSWLSNSTAGSWSAVGSVFSYQMNQATGVPTAFIWAAWGSSSIEGWMPSEMTTQFPYYADMLNLYQSIDEYRNGATTSSRLPSGYSTNQAGIAGLAQNGWTSTSDDIFMRTRPNILYNQMIHPVTQYGISGFIWYQGEANASRIVDVTQYASTLPAMITKYRERFDQGELPFLGVQLPSHNRVYWPWFREAQAQLETLNKAHYCVTIDTGSATNIHPTDKEPIGIRLARLARKYALGENIVADGPRYNSMSISGNQITISFNNASGLTTDDSLSPAEFEIAGSNQVFYPATSSSINGNQVTLSSNSVSNPVAVRYAWTPSPVNTVNLINSNNLPAAPFRTDNWSLPGLDNLSLATTADLETINSEYDTWNSKITWNSKESADAMKDPDGDGIVNLLEFALDLNPLKNDRSGLPTITQDGSDYLYTFNNIQPNITYEVLISSDLVEWSEPAFATLTNESEMPIRIPAHQAKNGKIFVKLRIKEDSNLNE